jgi:hypothetical protein
MSRTAVLQIVVEKATPRIRYVMDVVFGQCLAIPYVLLEKTGPLSETIFTIGYGKGDSSYFAAEGLLSETGIKSKYRNPQVAPWKQTKAFFFHDDKDSLLPFDPFACIFYLISLYQEYIIEDLDIHGRVPADQTLAVQHAMHTVPWVYHFIEAILEAYPDLTKHTSWPHSSRYKVAPSFDIDRLYLFQDRPLWKNFGFSALQLIKGDSSFGKAWVQYIKTQHDPLDIIHELEKSCKSDHLDPVFFFHLGDRGPYDKSNLYLKKEQKEKVSTLLKGSKKGIHPSYTVNTIQDLTTEVNRFEEIFNEKATRSRMHYLRVSMPQTFQDTLSCGIKAEHSLGYAEMPGFRLGICQPLNWYDIEKETVTDLILHPFQVMDTTMASYQHLSYQEALDQVERISAEVKKWGGTFSFLYHNEFKSNTLAWKGWNKLLEDTLDRAV